MNKGRCRRIETRCRTTFLLGRRTAVPRTVCRHRGSEWKIVCRLRGAESADREGWVAHHPRMVRSRTACAPSGEGALAPEEVTARRDLGGVDASGRFGARAGRRTVVLMTAKRNRVVESRPNTDIPSAVRKTADPAGQDVERVTSIRDEIELLTHALSAATVLTPFAPDVDRSRPARSFPRRRSSVRRSLGVSDRRRRSWLAR